MNGILFFLDRDPKLLRPTADRPTAFDREQMMKRYDERYDIYRDRADFIIKNDGAEKTAIDRDPEGVPMKFVVIDGPNLNVLGITETEKYGNRKLCHSA